MQIWQAIVLGTVQGLTEFLPVSSSGHLVLLQRLMEIDFGGTELLFDVLLHLGTLFAVVIVYFKKVLRMISHPKPFLFYLIAASIPAALVGFLLGDAIERYFYGGRFLSLGFALSALLLSLAQMRTERAGICKKFTLRHALCMGVGQAIAVLPGVSRSGTTLSAGVLFGGKREEVADFSFLMSIPVIFGSALFECVSLFSEGKVSSFDPVPVFAGMACAFLFGLLAIKFFLKLVKKGNLKPFIFYLLLLSAFCLTLSTAQVL